MAVAELRSQAAKLQSEGAKLQRQQAAQAAALEGLEGRREDAKNQVRGNHSVMKFFHRSSLVCRHVFMLSCFY